MTLAEDLGNPPEPESTPTESADIHYGDDGAPDGGTFEGIRSDEPLTDWTHVFKQFKLNPSDYDAKGGIPQPPRHSAPARTGHFPTRSQGFREPVRPRCESATARRGLSPRG
ncbi:hypothetical protein [Microbacterium sp. 1S1]|uniref:hypothetical protein n=1 Tax=Microbacterium sp. 1S1 TaxID=2606451 RepID=UPI0011EAF593|nr:hypothetical protein [Microbacterium sp. 1S1]